MKRDVASRLPSNWSDAEKNDWLKKHEEKKKKRMVEIKNLIEKASKEKGFNFSSDE